MIRNVLLMATSGLVLFSKEFVNAVSQPRLVGSLLTAMLEFSLQTTGMTVSYIELTNVAIFICVDNVAKVFCALFHDREDGVAFGRLICSQILNAFTEEYASDLGHFGRNLKDFHGFHNKIGDVIRTSVKPVLAKLQTHKGVLKVLYVSEDGSIASSTSEIDQLGVLANLKALIGLSIDTMSFVNNDCNQIMLDSTNNSRVFVWRIQKKSLLIVVVNKAIASNRYSAAVKEAKQTIDKLCILTANIHLVSR